MEVINDDQIFADMIQTIHTTTENITNNRHFANNLMIKMYIDTRNYAFKICCKAIFFITFELKYVPLLLDVDY